MISKQKLDQLNLGLRHRYKVPTLTHAPLEDDAAILSQDAQQPFSFLGRQPGTRAELRDCLSSIRATLHSFSASSAETVREDDVLLDALFQGGFGDKKVLGVSKQKVHTQLRTVYSLVLARLDSLNIDMKDIKIVAMICCGGAPFYHFGMGDSIEESVERQVELAVRFGFIFDLIPSTFQDYDSSLLDLSVSIGAVLLQKLKNNEHGRGRCDGILFCCKGTMSAALAAKAYSKWSKNNPKHIALMGMGTDLSQGFVGCAPEELSSAGYSISAINSLQDTNVGNGKKVLDDFMTTCTNAGCKSRATWLDINPKIQKFGDRQPEHNWYYEAFWRRSADSVRVTILKFLSDACNATPINSEYTTQKKSSVSKIRAQLESREKNVDNALDLNQIANFKSELKLNPVKPHVKHITEWVEGSSMFIKQ